MSDDLTPATAVLTAAFSHTPATPAVATPAPTGPAAPAVTPGFVEPHSGVSSPEAARMAQWTREDVARGKVTPEAAAKIFDELGIPEDQRVMSADTRTDEQKLIDDHFPPAKENDYCIRYFPPGREEAMSPALKEFDGHARTWLVSAEFPRELGNSLVAEIERVAKTTKGMTPAQLESYGETEFAKLERVYGPKLEEKLRDAGRMVQELEAKRPGLNAFLQSKGLGDSALIASQLIAQSERYWGRRKGR